MAINYLIQAQVVNIRMDKPRKDDIFLVDTNAWYWMNYTKARTLALPYQIANYPNYLNQAREVNSLLLYCGLSLAELAHNIEQVERQNYSPSLSSKEYRHTAVFDVVRYNLIFRFVGANGIRPQATRANTIRPYCI
jgi:hypothetical protein